MALAGGSRSGASFLPAALTVFLQLARKHCDPVLVAGINPARIVSGKGEVLCGGVQRAATREGCVGQGRHQMRTAAIARCVGEKISAYTYSRVHRWGMTRKRGTRFGGRPRTQSSKSHFQRNWCV